MNFRLGAKKVRYIHIYKGEFISHYFCGAFFGKVKHISNVHILKMQKLERRRTKSENFGKSKQLSLFVQKNEKPVEQ